MDKKEQKLNDLHEKIDVNGIGELNITTSGDEILKKFTEEPIQEDNIAKSIRKIHDQWSKIWNDDTIKEMFEKMFSIDEKFINELKGKNDSTEFVDKVTRDGNTESKGVMHLHEFYHIPLSAEFENYDKGNKSNREPRFSFSSDFEKHNEQMKDFMDYIAMLKEIGELAFIKVERMGVTITYSRLQGGLPIDHHEIEMIDGNDLKELYESLKVAYGPEFSHGCKHEMMCGYSLLPTIGDNIIIEISSDEFADNNWIYEEVHNKTILVEEPTKK